MPRSGDVLIEERGRHAQSGRNVVEAVHLDVLRQNVLRIHVHTHQSFHRCGVLGAIQALDRHIARLRTFGVGVERVLHPGDERIHILLRRLRIARRRHQMSAQLAQGLLPDPRVIRRGLEIQAVQREAADLRARVVAGEAVGVRASRDVDPLRLRRAGCRPRSARWLLVGKAPRRRSGPPAQ